MNELNSTLSNLSEWDLDALLSFLNISDKPEETAFQPPTHILSDYLEISSMSIIMALGAIFNSIVLRKLFKSYRYQTTVLHQRDVKAAFILLKLHLTVANLVVLLLHCPIKIGWLATYRWIAGAVSCKIGQFVVLFGLHLSSNIVTCIAFDRMRIVWRLCSTSVHSNAPSSNSIRQVKQLITGAWIMAVICSFPQMIVWTTLYLLPNWGQCTTVWMIMLFNNRGDIYPISYKTYQAFHLVMVFWLPFVVILICYSFITFKLASYACLPMEQASKTESMVVEMDNMNASGPLPVLCDNDINQRNSTASDVTEFPMNKKVTLLKTLHRARSKTYNDDDKKGSQSQIRRHTTDLNIERHSLMPQRPLVPAWRIQMRSKMFKTTAAVVTCYTICWFPYNILSWLVLYDVDLTNRLSDEINWLKSMVLINSVLNPFLYGFSDD